MLTIRLQRIGKKNAAVFRVVVAEKTAPVSKTFKEILGVYDPHRKTFTLKNPERAQYWISQNIELSPTVHNLFVTNGVLKADKVKAFSIKKKPEAEKPAESVKADATPVAEAAPAAEAPAAEPVAPVEPAAPTETPAA